MEKQTKDGYWGGITGPNPRIKWSLKIAKQARERGDDESAAKYEKQAADVASGALLKGSEFYDDGYNSPKTFEGWLYDGRNYNLFAILANVRNGYGFAGIETGSGFNCIQEDRGLPEDVSNEVETELDDEYLHNIGYITLRELVEFDWNQTTTHYGTVREEGYKQWKENGQPDSWSGAIRGPLIVELTNEEMEGLLNGTYKREPSREYTTRVEWKNTYAESVGDFYTESLPMLQQRSDKTDGSDIRIVFGFDS